MYPTTFALPRHGQSYTPDTDACDYQIGCALLPQQPNGDRLPVGYWSKSSSTPEKSYSNTKKECLAVVWIILTLWPHLYGDIFTLRTDHLAFKWILSLANSSKRLARWRLWSAAYGFEVEYRAGTTHKVGDVLFRLLRSEVEQGVAVDEVPCFLTEGSPFGDETQSEHREAVVAFLEQHRGENPEGIHETQYCTGCRPRTRNARLVHSGGVFACPQRRKVLLRKIRVGG